MEQSNFRVVILLVGLVGMVTIIVCVSGNHWIIVGDTYSGLWKECHPNKGCQQVERPWLPTIRSLMLVGLASQFLGLLYYTAMVSRPKLFGSIYMGVLMGIASVSLFAAISVFTYFNTDEFTESIQFNWCYFFAWFGAILTSVTTVMTCHDARRPASRYTQAMRIE